MNTDGCHGCIFRESDDRGFICSLADSYLVEMEICPLEEEACV